MIRSLLLATVACSLTAHAELKLPSLFTDHMVLQQNLAGQIWGWDTAGTAVTVTFGAQSQTATAGADGKWSVKLNPGAASTKPASLIVKGSSTREIKDVLVGEVWICSGQSNMQWSVSNTDDADLEIAAANYPNIRLITVPNVGTQEPQTDFKGAWTACTPETVPGFSAVGYHFGRNLHLVLNVPIGLINNAWGGSACEAWVDRPALEKDPRFANIITGAKANEARLASPEAKANYDKALQAYQMRAADAKTANKPFTERAPQSPDNWLRGNARPGNIFNGVLLPTIGYGIKGAIWYQGESNASRAWEYGQLFPFMIEHWRALWKQGDFPFYWVQLADFMAEKPEPADSAWAELRESQTQTQTLVKNGGQAVIIDIGEGKDIHPKNKRDVAERLTRLALAKDYGKTTLIHRSPEFKSAEVKGKEIIATLDTFGSKLATFDVNEVRGIAICGADRNWVWANAKVAGTNQVIASSPKVPAPVAIRYAWADNPVCNLFNAHSMPVTPFRSDDFPMITKPKDN